MCGEKNYVAVIWRGVVGSPPRVRGEVQTMFPSWAGDRITPACAGRSRRSPGLSSRGEDHPRVCGEKFATIESVEKCQGSPPRVRGEGLNIFCPLFLSGITPACAGRSIPPPLRFVNT